MDQSLKKEDFLRCSWVWTVFSKSASANQIMTDYNASGLDNTNMKVVFLFTLKYSLGVIN